VDRINPPPLKTGKIQPTIKTKVKEIRTFFEDQKKVPLAIELWGGEVRP